MRRMAMVVLAGGLLLGLPACGGKTDEKVRAAGVTPANVLAFLSVNLDPAIEQKRNLLSFAKAFPEAKVKGEFEETRDDLLADALEETGLDFKTDVKPWLGNEVAVAAVPGPEGAAPLVIGIIETSDKAKAEAALAKAKVGAYRVVDDFALVVGEQDGGVAALDAFEKQSQADSGSLAEAPRFTQIVDELHGDRLLLGWVDVKRLAELGGDLAGATGLDLSKQFGAAGPAAFDLHAADKALVLEGISVATATTDGRGEPKLTEGLPAATMAAFTIFDIGGAATRALDQVIGSQSAPTDGDAVADGVEAFQSEFQEATGLDLEADLLAWMGGEAVIAVAPAPAGREIPEVALIIEPTDRVKAESSIAKIKAALEAQELSVKTVPIAGATAYVASEELAEGVQPAMALFADRFVIASSPAYLTALATRSSSALGSSAPYRSVVTEGSSSKTQIQLVLLIDPIREAIEAAVGLKDDEDYVKNVRPNIEPLDVFGLRSYRSGRFDRFELKLTVS